MSPCIAGSREAATWPLRLLRPINWKLPIAATVHSAPVPAGPAGSGTTVEQTHGEDAGVTSRRLKTEDVATRVRTALINGTSIRAARGVAGKTRWREALMMLDEDERGRDDHHPSEKFAITEGFFFRLGHGIPENHGGARLPGLREITVLHRYQWFSVGPTKGH